MIIRPKKKTHPKLSKHTIFYNAISWNSFPALNGSMTDFDEEDRDRIPPGSVRIVITSPEHL